MSLEQWQQVIAANLTGVFYTTRCFLPGMLSNERGDIFIISSMNGKQADPGTAAYSASKFGLHGFAQALLYDVRRSNIRVMVINPSQTDTGEDTSPPHGPGIYLHAADIAATIVHLARLPGRTLVRDLDVWGTNPFPRE
jgi:3-oxoacyl-[acyl-carrier protein] reductase